MNQHNDRSDDPKPVIESGKDGAEHIDVTTRVLHLPEFANRKFWRSLASWHCSGRHFSSC